MFTLVNLLKNKVGWLEARGALSDTVLSSRIRLARNLNSLRFPTAASPKELRTSLKAAFSAARNMKTLKEAAYISLSEITEMDRHFLVERHLISMDLAEHPQERGVVVGDLEMTSLMVNEEDHLRIQTIEPGLSLDKALSRAMELDDNLGRGLDYAFRKDFGYLTSCPTNVGTGLRASCLVHLPSLVETGHAPAVLQEISRMGMAVRGFYGEGSKTFGDLFQISNATSIGRSEREFADIMEGMIKKILRHERQTREKLFSGHGKTHVEDHAWRAFAALSHARTMSYQEAMQLLSKVRLGLACGFSFDGLELSRINELILGAQPAHIQMRAGKELASEERDEWRAALIRRLLSRS